MMKPFFCAVLVVLFTFSSALASTQEKKLPSEEEEIRAHQLFRNFRCMVCQSQSLDESNAPLALDLRAVIREHIALGETDAEITAYLQGRYGEYILFSPPVTESTLLLWFGPFIMLLLGGIGVLSYIRKQNNAH